jgi:hypothetical protein
MTPGKIGMSEAMGCEASALVDEKWTASRVSAALTARWPDDRYLHVYEAPLHSDRQGGAIDVAVFALWRSLRHEIDAIEVKVSYSDWCKEWRRVEWRVTEHTGRTIAHHRQPTEQSLAYHAGEDYIDDYGHGYARRHWGDNPPPADFWPLVERIESVATWKSEDWRKHCHRFWVAAPAGLAIKIAQDVKDKPELDGWGVIGVDDSGSHVLVKPKNLTPKPLAGPQWIGIVRAAADSGVQALFRAEARGYQRARQEADRSEQASGGCAA